MINDGLFIPNQMVRQKGLSTPIPYAKVLKITILDHSHVNVPSTIGKQPPTNTLKIQYSTHTQSFKWVRFTFMLCQIKWYLNFDLMQISIDVAGLWSVRDLHSLTIFCVGGDLFGPLKPRCAYKCQNYAAHPMERTNEQRVSGHGLNGCRATFGLLYYALCG